jgi:hypothetical protein
VGHGSVLVPVVGVDSHAEDGLLFVIKDELPAVESAAAKRREAAQKVGQYLLIRSFFSDDAELFPTTPDVAE